MWQVEALQPGKIVSWIHVKVAAGVGVGVAVVVGGLVVAGVVVVVGGLVVVGMRLCVMALTAPAASTVPPETVRFLNLLSGIEVAMMMSRMALGTRFGSMERMRATKPVTCGAAIEVPLNQP